MSKPDAEDVERYNDLIASLNAAIIQASSPEDMVTDGDYIHAKVHYNPDMVIHALASVAASVAVQSGAYTTPKQRRELADNMRKVFLDDWKGYEKQVAEALARYNRGMTQQ